uniref:Uncharacterized protein n=1 Tax=Spongospora subterranea TaxID=70186 RepID=A0A0H5R703_9EUKA|eukprot:CRZ09905.1 hypothetical protein [Spongospora subterranea]
MSEETATIPSPNVEPKSNVTEPEMKPDQASAAPSPTVGPTSDAPSAMQTQPTNPVPAPLPEASGASAAASPAPEHNLATMPVREYLDETVVPLLLRGMLELAKKRPEKPAEFLGNFLLANKETVIKKEL